jgi:hypothetical protein
MPVPGSVANDQHIFTPWNIRVGADIPLMLYPDERREHDEK